MEFLLLWATYLAIMYTDLERGIGAGIVMATLYFAYSYAQACCCAPLLSQHITDTLDRHASRSWVVGRSSMAYVPHVFCADPVMSSQGGKVHCTGCHAPNTSMHVTGWTCPFPRCLRLLIMGACAQTCLFSSVQAPSAKQLRLPMHAGDGANVHGAADAERGAASSERAQDPGPLLLAPGRHFALRLHLLRLFCLNL